MFATPDPQNNLVKPVLILLIRKLKFREVKGSAQGHASYGKAMLYTYKWLLYSALVFLKATGAALLCFRKSEQPPVCSFTLVPTNIEQPGGC